MQYEQLTCANYHRLGVVARVGESGSRARNASGWNLVKEVPEGTPRGVRCRTPKPRSRMGFWLCLLDTSEEVVKAILKRCA